MKFSIVCPVYNSEKHLDESIQSVLNQTFKDWELILVDDGSVDRSAMICQKYLKFDNRIKYFYKKNEGPYSARVLGIKKSTGEYLYFLDSDDTLDKNCLNEANKKSNNSDMILTNALVFNGNTIKPLFSDKVLVKMSKDPMYHCLITNNLGWSCLKFLKKSLFDGIEFPNVSFRSMEDCFLLSLIVRKIKSTSIQFQPLYNYFNNHSILTRESINKDRDSYSVIDYFYKNAISLDKRLLFKFKKHQFISNVNYLYSIKRKKKISKTEIVSLLKLRYSYSSFSDFRSFRICPFKCFIKFILLGGNIYE